METMQMLENLCQVDSVSGSEEAILDAVEKTCAPLGPCHRTVHKSLVCEVMKAKEGRPHLLLNAHIDEIGLAVSYIEEEGFLRTVQCGGVDRRLVMGSAVKVHGDNGIVYPGIIGSLPAHVQSGEKKNPKIEDVWVDVGMTGAEAKEKISLGSKISFVGPLTPMENNTVSSKAHDDRSCCVAIIKAAEQIKALWEKENLPAMGLTLLLSSQEETSGLGAHTGAFEVKPTQAIVVDVTFGTTPEIADQHCGDLNKGPMIGFGAVLSRRMSKELVAAAKENNIPYQMEVMGGGHTGTDADGIAPSGAGIETCCVSLPLRYMHTPIETISTADVDNIANVIEAYAKRLVR